MMTHLKIGNFLLLGGILLLLFGGFSFAKAQITYGISGGINLASLKIPDMEMDKMNKAGVFISLPVDFKISDIFSIQLEANYVEKGLALQEAGTVQVPEGKGQYEVNYDIDLDYLDFPVLGKVTIPLGFADLYLMGGPGIGLALNGKTKFDSKEWLNGELIDHDTFDEKIQIGKTDGEEGDIRRVDFGIHAGAGLGFKVNKGKIIIQSRYNLGISNINYGDGESEDVIKNKGIGLMAGYVFTFGN